MDFSGVAQQTNTYHKRKSSDDEVVIDESFEYDSQNRLLKHYHEVVGKTPKVLLTENHYNELGQLEYKRIGDNIQQIDYAYNIRGWLTSINNPDNMGTDLFAYRLKYTNPANPSLAKSRYNGNIAETDWRYKGGSLQRYGYQYDMLNRLLAGNYQEPESTNPENGNNNEYLRYDLNGNITQLQRYTAPATGSTPEMIDLLNYTYYGNKVVGIADDSQSPSGYEGGGGEIVYEQNGNMIAMPDKGITNIAYNFLNLPMQITQNDNTTDYLYRADGVKLKKVFTLNNAEGGSVINTEYLDGFQYSTPNTEPLRLALRQTDDATTSAVTAGEEQAFTSLADRAVIANPTPDAVPVILSFFPTAEGYYDYENMRYIYQYKDHLGNVRLSFTKDLKVMDKNDYYPFGMSFLKTSVSLYDPMAIPYNYKFQGQELQETGFFKWRNYMPDVGRFTTIDPLAEKYAYNSVYAFSENRVVDGRELEGLEWIEFMPFLMENAAIRPELIDPMTETVSKTSETVSKTAEGVQKSNERVKYDNELERAKDKMDGIGRAQENLKRNAPNGSKQNAIRSTRKSEQNLDHILNRIKNSNDIDEFDVKFPPVKKDNLDIPKPQPVIPNFVPQQPQKFSSQNARIEKDMSQGNISPQQQRQQTAPPVQAPQSQSIPQSKGYDMGPRNTNNDIQSSPTE